MQQEIVAQDTVEPKHEYYWTKKFISKAIYGLMSVLAILVVMEGKPLSAWSAAVTVLGTTLAVTLVDIYSSAIAEMLTQRRRLSLAELRVIGSDVAPGFLGAQGPTLVLVLAALGFMSLRRAITVAEVVVFLFLFAYGWRLGRMLHKQWFVAPLSGVLLVAIGEIIITIKALFY